MNKREILEQRKKLRAVPDDEWRQALKECVAYVTWKTWGQTGSGCHSELELAEPASEHYTKEAMMKLWEGERTWKPGLSLKEQLIEVAHGMISNRPVTYRRRRWRKVSIERELTPTGTGLTNDGSEIRGDEDDSCGFDVEDKKESMEETYDRAKAAVKGNKRLEAYVDAIKGCNNFDEISSDLNITKKQAYKLQGELMERLNKSRLK